MFRERENPRSRPVAIRMTWTAFPITSAGALLASNSHDELIARALALAIEAIDRLPPNWQAGTDKTAMIALLHHITAPGQAASLRLLARARLEQQRVEVVTGGAGH
jgi:hypothetical protein